ncbi:MAG: DUF465 domain-containing protein [Rhodobacteraceae bacterium]|nr:DUF465 domain-containing protein [Paracoccaceae bacterium]
MNLNSRLNELQKKHANLAQQIEADQRRPGIDDLEIGELKREKLRLKEEIVRVSSQV